MLQGEQDCLTSHPVLGVGLAGLPSLPSLARQRLGVGAGALRLPRPAPRRRGGGGATGGGLGSHAGGGVRPAAVLHRTIKCIAVQRSTNKV